jgi:hypothetical protein
MAVAVSADHLFRRSRAVALLVGSLVQRPDMWRLHLYSTFLYSRPSRSLVTFLSSQSNGAQKLPVIRMGFADVLLPDRKPAALADSIWTTVVIPVVPS